MVPFTSFRVTYGQDRRIRLGLHPNSRRNASVRWLCELKPLAYATSDSPARESSTSSSAWRSRYRTRIR
jgi:hypothetical protein